MTIPDVRAGQNSHESGQEGGGGTTGPDIASKPIPDPEDDVTRPFWHAASQGVLVVQRCGGCQKFFHPPVALCPLCQNFSLTFVPVSGAGYVYSFGVVHDQRMPAFDALIPYVVAHVLLDDAPGVMMLSNMPDTDIADVKSGMRVKVAFEQIADGVSIPQFVPAELADKRPA